MWTGCDLFGLLRILARNRCRVHPRYLPDCLIDLIFAFGNSGLKGLSDILFSRRVDRVQLTDDPIFIIGHWRTGTTLLHELLALDPQHRVPTTFECFAPNHFLITERLVKRWIGFALPRRRPPDQMAMGWDQPQEDEFALCNSGVPSPYATITFPNHPPQFQEYLDLEDLSRSQRDRWCQTLLTFLKQLTYNRPGRLVLKSPTHTFRLPTLCEMFPRAKFVYMVRDPYAVFASTVRLWKSLYASQGYQKPTYQGLDEFVFETFTKMHQRLEATRGLVDRDRFHTLRYEDLVRDPVAEMRTLYERLALGDYDPIEPAVEDYFHQRADYRPNRHVLAPEIREQVGRRWRPYIEQYGYEM